MTTDTTDPAAPVAAAPESDFLALAADLARLEAATRRADRLRYVATLRHIFDEPAEPRDEYATAEGARAAACRDAGVPPYGPL